MLDYRTAFKHTLRWTMIGAIRLQQNGGSAFPDIFKDNDYEASCLSLFNGKDGTPYFSAALEEYSGEFEIMTGNPVKPTECPAILQKAIRPWWLKYRFLLLDYWNVCHPEKYTSHPEEWGRSDDQR
jgi:hypothetical protein